MKLILSALLISMLVFTSCQTNNESALMDNEVYSIDTGNGNASLVWSSNESPESNESTFVAQRDLIRTAVVHLDSEDLNYDKKIVLDMCNQFQ
ncbi:MAG: hypothetical protein ACPGWM_11635, partial [Flavobacteriales bacterium]